MDDSCSNLFSDQHVIQAEQARLRTRRGLPDGAAVNDIIGLALSGGGVRSATFNLGLLQAMQRHNVLLQVDYLSTVSGGGYIGSSYTWLAAQSGGEFPFGTRRDDNVKSGGRIQDWIRLHASYLTPGGGLDGFALLAAVLRGIFVNLVVIVPFFLLFMWALLQFELFDPILQGTAILGGLLLIGWLTRALYSGQVFNNAYAWRRKLDCTASILLRLILTGLVLGSLPTMHELAASWITTAFSTVTVTGLFSMVFGWWSRDKNTERTGKSGWTLRIGLVLLLYGILLATYDFVWRYLYEDLYTIAVSLMELVAFGSVGNWALALVSASLLISVLIGLFGNINHVSMHRFYRDRLLEAYMMPANASAANDNNHHADHFYLRDIAQTSAPYHLINANMNTIASDDDKLRIRGGDNFIFSPLYCGSRGTGYAANADRICNEKKITGYLGGMMDLATAFTISGAAVDPNTGVTRSRPLALLMSLLNVRLGYWIRNPQKPSVLGGLSRPRWHFDLLYEMLGIKLNEHHRHVHLSDGGHFENLAAYELIRRQCKYIIVSDAAADPDWTFADLARLIELVRVDFGAAIVMDVSALQPQGEQRLSQQPYVVGHIYYRDGSEGFLLYVKSCMVAGLNDELYSYRREHRDFPDEPTSDQFFSEMQFEAYRELGFQLGRKIFAQRAGDDWQNRSLVDICRQSP